MPEWVNKILKHNPGEKSLKTPFTIYIDLECTLKKITIYSKQPRKILYRKKARHDPSGWAMFTRRSFSKKENKINYYREKD